MHGGRVTLLCLVVAGAALTTFVACSDTTATPSNTAADADARDACPPPNRRVRR